MQIVSTGDNLYEISNRKECNGQESIQLPNTFCSKKAMAPQSKHYKQKVKQTSRKHAFIMLTPLNPTFI